MLYMKQSEMNDSPANCPDSHASHAPGQSVITGGALIKGVAYIINQWK